MKNKTPATGKIAKPKKVKTTAKFVSFTVTAVIPTQQYGNIQPKIEVQADSYQDARDFVMPLIEEMYIRYGESKPDFLGRITETIKVVKAVAGEKLEKGDLVKKAPEEVPTAQQEAAKTLPPQATASTTPTATAPVQKPESVLKAEKAVSLAMTEDALNLIKNQIEKSVKIPAEFKPALLNTCEIRRVDIKK